MATSKYRSKKKRRIQRRFVRSQKTKTDSTNNNAISLDESSITDPETILQLQRVIGNQATLAIINRTEDHDKGCGCGTCQRQIQRTEQDEAINTLDETDTQDKPQQSFASQFRLQRTVDMLSGDHTGSESHPRNCGCGSCGQIQLKRESDNGNHAQKHANKSPIESHDHINSLPFQRGIISRKKKTPREQFNKAKFKLKDWIPSTGGGKFDAEYKPSKGQLKITVKVHFDFQDSAAYASTATDPEDTVWKKSQKKAWYDKFVAAVMTKWGNIPTISCDKPGFEDVAVKPLIDIQQVSKPSKAHYALDVTKAFTKKTGGMRAGGMSGLTRDGGGAFQEFDTEDKINDPEVSQHLAQTEQRVNILPAYERDRERMITELATLDPIVFKDGNGELADGMDAKVVALIGVLTKLKKYSALSGLHPIKIQIALGARESASLVGTRFGVLKEAIENAGIEHPLTSQQIPGVVARSATIVAGPDTDDTKDKYLEKWDRYTAAHEFGHMIGLLDEYCPAVSPELLIKMVDEGQISDEEAVVTNTNEARKGQDEASQTAYASLLDKTGLEAQSWSRANKDTQEKSTSLMSGGFEVLKQHYVTIWEALTELTKDHVEETHWKL